MSAGLVIGSVGRMLGIVAIFSLLGPPAFSALVLLIVAAFRAPLLALLQLLVNPDALRMIVSIADWVLGIAAMLAAFPPSAITGLIFAVTAVGAGVHAFWAAWLAAAVAVAAIIAIGLYVFVPQESTAVILPKAQTAGQATALFVMLTVLAIPPATLCWWLAKPLCRASIAA